MRRENILKIIVISFTFIFLLLLLFPFFVMISTMLRPSREVYTSPPYWIPKHPTLSNFIGVWNQVPLVTYFTNSLIIAGGTMVLNTLLSVPAAYAISRFRFPGKQILLYMLIVFQMFSPIVVVISLFKIMFWFHLLNTYTGLIFSNTAFTLPFTIWMLNGYFKSVPVDIEEAALIDGCTYLQAIQKIVLPIAAPGLVTTMIYSFIFAWNEFMFALTFIQSAKKMPITIGLYSFVGQYTTQWEYLATASFLAIIPIVVLFLLIEKQLVAGLVGGAVKG